MGNARLERIDDALASAARFLAARQSADGAWRSTVYGPFRDGDSLTPLVLQALEALPHSLRPETECRRGAEFLVRLAASAAADPDGPHGLTYPVYTAAGSVLALARSTRPEHRRAVRTWLADLRRRQLAEDLGWGPNDPEYGGWSYSVGLPRKPAAGQPLSPLSEPNLSATLFAVEALRAAGAPPDDSAFRKALRFIARCQNFEEDAARRDPRFDDGGFFFILSDPVRNKAGIAGVDSAGRERFRSYGSTTADGLRALLACGAAPDAPRVAAARQWLEARFRADDHPGDYAPDREPSRPSLFYYYAWSVAEAFRATVGGWGRSEAESSERRAAPSRALASESVRPAGGEAKRLDPSHPCWGEALADELLRRQRPDGSWSNPAVAVREDDPLVATPLAIQALMVCRASLAERH